MGLVWNCFWESPLVYVICAFSAGALTLTNQLEPAFARSLVECDVPVAANEFTGSSSCGDRRYVINEGQMISGLAQSQEHIWRLLALLTVAVTADISGRRPALLRGVACVCISMILFMLATLHKPWARSLFAFAQGLQGAFPLDLIGTMIRGDLISRPGSDAQSICTICHLVVMASTLSAKALSISLQLLEVTEFLRVWLVICLLSSGIWLVALWHFPETREWSASKIQEQEELQGVKPKKSYMNELREYVLIYKENHFLRGVLLRDVFATLADDSSFTIAACMAIFSYSQAQAVARFIWLPVWMLLWSSVSPSIIRLRGERLTLKAGRIFMQVSWLCLTLIAPVSAVGFWAMVYVPKISYGLGPLESAIQTKCLPEHIRAKAVSLTTLNVELLRAVAIMMYSLLFDATSQTYVDVARPFLVSISCRCLAWMTFWMCIWPFYAKEADALQDERVQRESGIFKSNLAVVSSKKLE